MWSSGTTGTTGEWWALRAVCFRYDGYDRRSGGFADDLRYDGYGRTRARSVDFCDSRRDAMRARRAFLDGHGCEPSG